MRSYRSKIAMGMAAAVMGWFALGCNEINKSSSPVMLVLSTAQNLQTIDLNGNAPGSTACNQTLGTVSMEARLLQDPNNIKLPTDNRFNDVRVTSYRVSYVRTDGGRLVPASFVRSISTTLTAGAGSQNLTNFLAFDTNAFNQAPFVALLPQNGGRDPETGQNFIKMDVILEVFGETLAGSKVSGSTRIPLNFCFNCGGCS